MQRQWLNWGRTIAYLKSGLQACGHTKELTPLLGCFARLVERRWLPRPISNTVTREPDRWETVPFNTRVVSTYLFQNGSITP